MATYDLARRAGHLYQKVVVSLANDKLDQLLVHEWQSLANAIDQALENHKLSAAAAGDIHVMAQNMLLVGKAVLRIEESSSSIAGDLEAVLDGLELEDQPNAVLDTTADPNCDAALQNQQSDSPLIRRWFYHNLIFPYPSPHLKAAFISLDPTLTSTKIDGTMTNWRRRSGWTEVSDLYAGGCKYMMSIIVERVIAGHPYPLPGLDGGVKKRADVVARVERMARYARGEDEAVRGWLTTLPINSGASSYDLSHILQPDDEVRAIDARALKAQRESERRGEIIQKNGKRIQAGSKAAVAQAQKIAADARDKEAARIKRLRKLFLYAEGFDAFGGKRKGDEYGYESSSDGEGGSEDGEEEEDAEEMGGQGKRKGKQREEPPRSPTPPPLFAQGALRLATPLRMLSPSSDDEDNEMTANVRDNLAYAPYHATPASSTPTAPSVMYDSPAVVSPQIRFSAIPADTSAVEEFHSYDDFISSMGDLDMLEHTTGGPTDQGRSEGANQPQTPEAPNSVEAEMEAWAQKRNVSGGSTISNMTSMSSLSAASGDLPSVPLVPSMTAPLVPSQGQGRHHPSQEHAAASLSPLDTIEQGIEDDENIGEGEDGEVSGNDASPLAGKGTKRRGAGSMIRGADSGEHGLEHVAEEHDDEYEDVDMESQARSSKKAKGEQGKRVPVQHKARRLPGIRRPKRPAPSASFAHPIIAAGPTWSGGPTPSVFTQAPTVHPAPAIIDPSTVGYTSHPPQPHPYATHPHYPAYVHAYASGPAEYAASSHYWASLEPQGRVVIPGPPGATMIGPDGRAVPMPPHVVPYPHVPVQGHAEYAPLPPPPHVMEQGQVLYPPPHAYPGYGVQAASPAQGNTPQMVQHPPSAVTDPAMYHPAHAHLGHPQPGPTYPQHAYTAPLAFPAPAGQYGQPTNGYAQGQQPSALPIGYTYVPYQPTLAQALPPTEAGIANAAQPDTQDPVRSPAVQLLPLPEVRVDHVSAHTTSHRMQRPHSAQGNRTLEVQVHGSPQGMWGKEGGLDVPLMSPSMARRHSETDASQEKIRRDHAARGGEVVDDIAPRNGKAGMVFGAGEGRQWEFAPQM